MQRLINVMLLLALGACSETAAPAKPETKPRETAPFISSSRPPTLRIAITPDLEGTLEPCGCTSRPVGGVDRLAFALDRLTGDGVPVLRLATGELFARPNGSARTDHQTQDLWRADVLSAVLANLKLDALVPGARDLAEQSQRLEDLARETHAPLLGTGSSPELHNLHLSTLREVSSLQVGILSAITDARAALPTSSARLANEARRLRERGARLLLLVMSGSTEAARTLAAQTGADLVVRSSGEPETAAIAVGSSAVISGGQQAEGFWLLDFWLREDVSQGLRLIDAPPAEAAGPKQDLVLARYQALDQHSPRDPDTRKLLDQLFTRIDAHNASTQTKSTTQPQARFVGAQTCAACHTAAYFWWLATPHGRAYESLKSRGRKLDLDCIGCHVTGWDQPTGANLGALQNLQGVGCESCHGPGSRHVDNPQRARLELKRAVPEAVCVTCHDGEHSDGFDYARARTSLLRKGHGEP